MRVLQTGDLHLGRGRASWGEAVALDRGRRTLDAVYQTAVAQKCHAIVVCGDVFDAKSVTNAEREVLVGALSRYAGHGGLPWYVIGGNHDATSEGMSNLDFLAVLAESRELPKLHVSFANKPATWETSHPTLRVLGVPCLLSENQKSVEQLAASVANDGHEYIFLGHGTVGGAVRNDRGWRPSEAEDAKRLSLAKAAATAPNVIWWGYGDLHTRQALPTLPPGAHGAYAGSPIQMDFGETPNRGVLVVAFDGDHDGERVRWRYVGKRYVRLDGEGSGFAPLVTVTTEEQLETLPEETLIRLGSRLKLSEKRKAQVVTQFKVVDDHSTPEAVLEELRQVGVGPNDKIEVFDPLTSDLATVQRDVLTALPPVDEAVRLEACRVVGLAIERYRERVYLS